MQPQFTRVEGADIVMKSCAKTCFRDTTRPPLTGCSCSTARLEFARVCGQDCGSELAYLRHSFFDEEASIIVPKNMFRDTTRPPLTGCSCSTAKTWNSLWVVDKTAGVSCILYGTHFSTRKLPNHQGVHAGAVRISLSRLSACARWLHLAD